MLIKDRCEKILKKSMFKMKFKHLMKKERLSTLTWLKLKGIETQR